MHRTAEQIAAAIDENVSAVYGDAISYEDFCARNTALWSEAEAHGIGFALAVRRIVVSR